jgi:hypothetical protein
MSILTLHRRIEMSIVERKEGYEQVMIWPGTILNDEDIPSFEQWMGEQGFKIQFLETIITKPDMKDGCPVLGTGGRHDIFFGVHQTSLPKISVAKLRFQEGMRWLEDAIAPINGGNRLYPEYVSEYRCWE